MPREFSEKSKYSVVLVLFKILEFFDHENVVSLLDLGKPPAPIGYDDVYIITELMQADLHKLIYSKQSLQDDHYQYFMY